MMMLGVMWMMTAAVVGFMLGRVSMYGQTGVLEAVEDMEEGHSMEEEHSVEKRHSMGERDFKKERYPMEERHSMEKGHSREVQPTGGKRRLRGRGKGHCQEEGRHWSVASPVSGTVTAQGDGECPALVIEPDCDRVYAPASGKITRLYPMGNAFRLLTEFGTELYVRIGNGDDELLGRYYRPRILQNEIVGKGKVLVEFDRAGLEAEGIACQVSVCVEGCRYGGNVRGTAGERVRLGEEIFQVQEAPEPEKPGPETRFLYRVFD